MLKKLFFMMLISLALKASYAQYTASTQVELAKDYSLMPKVTIESLSEGQTQVSIETQREDGSTQVYIVLTDRQGNQKKMIKTLSPEGVESNSVVGKDTNVPVLPITRLAIGADGTLVNAEAQPEKSITPASEPSVTNYLVASEDEEENDELASESASQADDEIAADDVTSS